MNGVEQKPIIELFNFDGLGLIILFPSGVVYTNQVGGLGCLHPQAEGVFVPLSIRHKKVLFALQQNFNGDWHHIKETDAQIVDKLLRSDGFEFIKVDRTKLEESFEAWIYVDVEKLSEPVPLLNGFGKVKGILTWENSD
jgi:hypothetical protein